MTKHKDTRSTSQTHTYMYRQHACRDAQAQSRHVAHVYILTYKHLHTQEISRESTRKSIRRVPSLRVTRARCARTHLHATSFAMRQSRASLPLSYPITHR